MPAIKLGKYILDHDEKSFYIEGTKAVEINYSKNKPLVNNVNMEGLLYRDHHNYRDFKFSFDELNFTSEKEAISKLENVVKDICKIEINNPNKASWIKKINVNDDFSSFSDNDKKEFINKFVEEYYSKDKKGLPEVIKYKHNKKNQIEVKLRRSYDRVINLSGSVISIHTNQNSNDDNFEGYTIKPHIHIIIDKNKALGKNFSKLRKELYIIFKKHELTSSHNTYIKRNRNSEEYKEYRLLKDRLTSFSWVVNKHEKGEYIIKQLNQYKRNSKCVKLDNIEEKLNRYLELGGSYDFARKIKINLKEKLDIETNLKAPNKYIKANNNIDNKKYKEIIIQIKNDIISGNKISERYKEYAQDILKKDQVNMKELLTGRAIKELIKNRGYHYDNKYNKVIDENKINTICNKYIKKLENINRQNIYNHVINKIRDFTYIDQNVLREDLKKAGIKDIKNTLGISEVAIIFKGTEKYANKNLKDRSSYNSILSQIKNMDLNITDNWRKQISLKIYAENNLKWEDVNSVDDVKLFYEYSNANISDKLLNNVSRGIYNEKIIKVKELLKDNFAFNTIKTTKAQKSLKTIKEQIDIIEPSITEEMKDDIAKEIFKEEIYDIDNSLRKTSSLKNSYNSIKRGLREVNRKLNEIPGTKQDIISEEINKIENDTRQIFMSLRQIELILLNFNESLSSNNYSSLDFNDIDNKLSNHEEDVSFYQEKLDSIDNEINGTMSANNQDITTLEKELLVLKNKDEELKETLKELKDTEDNLLNGFSLQYYEKKAKNIQSDIVSLKQDKISIKSKVFLSRKNIDEEIELKARKFNDIQKIIKSIKKLRINRNKVIRHCKKLSEIKKIKNKKINNLLRQNKLREKDEKGRRD